MIILITGATQYLPHILIEDDYEREIGHYLNGLEIEPVRKRKRPRYLRKNKRKMGNRSRLFSSFWYMV